MVVDSEAMKSAIDHAIKVQPQRSSAVVRKTRDSSETVETCSQSAITPISVHAVAFPDGTITSFKTFTGENNPAKKPAVEKRDYSKIWNWEDGCPKCDAKPSSYPAFRKHLSRGCGPSERVTCEDCGNEVAKSNTTHLKKCPNKNKSKK